LTSSRLNETNDVTKSSFQTTSVKFQYRDGLSQHRVSMKYGKLLHTPDNWTIHIPTYSWSMCGATISQHSFEKFPWHFFAGLRAVF